MLSAKKTIVPATLALLMGAGLLAAASPASARVVCNRDGDCWHTENVPHAPGIRFESHPDDWFFHQRWDDHRHFRDYHEGRGYYRNGIWITL
jgi:hypothetical protein